MSDLLLRLGMLQAFFNLETILMSFRKRSAGTNGNECCVLVHRYENLVQIRCLLEGVSPDAILNDWHTVLPEYMQKWGVERGQVCNACCTCCGSRPAVLPVHAHSQSCAGCFLQLVELFGGTRDEWMKSDLKGWLHMNRFYPKAPELLQHAVDQHETYIVTTKQVSHGRYSFEQ